MGVEHKLSKIRDYTSEPVLDPLVDKLAEYEITPDCVTETGRNLALLGMVFIKRPRAVAKVISFVTRGKLNVSQGLVETIGKVIYTGAVVCDGVDGKLARKLRKTTKYGKFRDAEVDREVDLCGPALDSAAAKEPIDKLIAEGNLATVSLPSLLRSVAAIHDIEVPEFAITGSRATRLITQGVGLLFKRWERASSLALIAESVSTATLRYLHIRRSENKEAILEANNQLKTHLATYLKSKCSMFGGLIESYGTWRAMVGEYSEVKRREVWRDETTT